MSNCQWAAGTVKARDARPWTPELRAEREALSLIHWLRDQDKPQSEWFDAIAANPCHKWLGHGFDQSSTSKPEIA